MKTIAAILALSTSTLLAAPAPDWQATLTAKPGKFPPLRPLTAHYEFGWSGLKAAEADTRFSREGAKNQLALTARSTGMARTLWKMDTAATSLCERDSLRPISLKQTETYSKKTFVTTVDFTRESVTRLRVVQPPDKAAPKPKTFKAANAQDLQSALLLIRSQPLRDGDEVVACVYPGNSGYLATIKVAGRETVKAAGRDWPAIRCDLSLRAINKDFTLAPHAKFKKASAWLSDDADRLLLRIDAEVFVGRVWAELKQVNFAK
jgi:hypothetical protein